MVVTDVITHKPTKLVMTYREDNVGISEFTREKVNTGGIWYELNRRSHSIEETRFERSPKGKVSINFGFENLSDVLVCGMVETQKSLEEESEKRGM